MIHAITGGSNRAGMVCKLRADDSALPAHGWTSLKLGASSCVDVKL
jgi:hypothetical protein